jgi:hypothetical protein
MFRHPVRNLRPGDLDPVPARHEWYPDVPGTDAPMQRAHGRAGAAGERATLGQAFFNQPSQEQ